MTQGFYRFHVADKSIPSMTYSVNNILVIFKATICQIVLPQLSPNLFHRIELWGYRRKKQQADIVKFGPLFCGVPSSAIHDNHSMPARRQAVLDAFQVLSHGFSVGFWHHNSRRLACGRTGSTEQISRHKLSLPHHSRTSPCSCPDTSDCVLLSNTRFVLKPDIHHIIRYPFREQLTDLGGKVFLKPV